MEKLQKKRELPFNKNPYIASNVNRAGLFSILSSEEYAGTLNAVLSKFEIRGQDEVMDIHSLERFDMHLEKVQVETEQAGGRMKFYSHPYDENKFAYIYTSVKKVRAFQIEAKIDYLQDSNAWSCARLVLSHGLERRDNLLYSFKDALVLTVVPKGRMVLQSSMLPKPIQIKNIDLHHGIYLKIVVEDKIHISYALEKEKWISILDMNVDVSYTEAGFCVHPKINPFFYDFFTSHLQLCCMNDTMAIAPHFEMYERNYSGMLQTLQVPLELVGENKDEILSYFIKLLMNNYYINVGLNEYYIADRSLHQKQNFVHANFFYGVDVERQVFQIMGFDGRLKYSEIDFEHFVKAIESEKSASAKITLYKYGSRAYPSSLNIETVIMVLNAYLRGEALIAISASKVLENMEDGMVTYGLEIYERIINEKEYRGVFIKDIRISFQMYEHNKIMLEFLIFLQHIGLLTEEQYNKCQFIYQDIIKINKLIQTLLLRNRKRAVVDIEEKIILFVGDLKEKEESVLKELLQNLKEKRILLDEGRNFD